MLRSLAALLPRSLASAMWFALCGFRWHPRRGSLFAAFAGFRDAVCSFAAFAGIRDAPRGAGVAPVRGGTYFLCRGKESRQRKPLTP
ncbi:hypothetical protein, partial [Paraburkholderia sp. LEh10]|uniref:hypothetical protein n=1 Tax=Paraburkholderia sp. LEh10 TaxID=2821353 RepID=UPI001AEACAC2